MSSDDSRTSFRLGPNSGKKEEKEKEERGIGIKTINSMCVKVKQKNQSASNCFQFIIFSCHEKI